MLAAVDAVERAGLRVARVDLSSFGALRSIGDEHLMVQAVIDLGAHLTSIVIHDHGVPKLVRTLARGGQELTDLLVDDLDLNFEEAERLKRATGLLGERRPPPPRPCRPASDRCWPRSEARSTISGPAVTAPSSKGSR